jgi:hypothetical protein
VLRISSARSLLRLASTASIIAFARASRGFRCPLELIPLRTFKRLLRFFSGSFDSTGFFEVPNTLIVSASRLQASSIVFLCHLPFGLLPMFNVSLPVGPRVPRSNRRVNVRAVCSHSFGLSLCFSSSAFSRPLKSFASGGNVMIPGGASLDCLKTISADGVYSDRHRLSRRHFAALRVMPKRNQHISLGIVGADAALGNVVGHDLQSL